MQLRKEGKDLNIQKTVIKDTISLVYAVAVDHTKQQ